MTLLRTVLGPRGSGVPLRVLPLALVAACQAQAPAPPPAAPAQDAEPAAHFPLARDLRVFATNGDLGRLRIMAEALAGTTPEWGIPAGSDAELAAVHQAARGAAESTTADRAAEAVAQMAAACGDCHVAADPALGARFEVSAPAFDNPATRHGDYLGWVSRLFWAGLVGPSDAMWRTGAGALAGADAVPAPRARFIPADEVARSAERIGELGVEAVLAGEPGTRAVVLGRLWGACADCHVQAGVR